MNRQPLWRPFTTSSGILAVRTETGLVAYVDFIHRERVQQYEARQVIAHTRDQCVLLEEVERAWLLAEMEAEARGGRK